MAVSLSLTKAQKNQKQANATGFHYFISIIATIHRIFKFADSILNCLGTEFSEGFTCDCHFGQFPVI